MSDKKTDNNIVLENVHLNLNTSAGQISILRGISLKIKSGESVAIIGPSGGGKTTLIMAIAGLEKISSGSLRVAGVETSELGEDDLAVSRRENFGIVFQDFHLIPTMTATENVVVPLEISGSKDPFNAARKALEAVNLGHRLKHYPGELSGGEKQRVAIARAFALRPNILLADEPTGNLDAKTGSEIMDILFALNKQNNTTLMLVTHDSQLADQCQRHILLQDGEIAKNVVMNKSDD